MDEICTKKITAVEDTAEVTAEVEVPPYFLCPISLQTMKDPVTVSTGITYDREHIEKWISANKNKSPTCPVTKQVITHVDMLTPNHTLRRLIQSWCTLHASAGVERFPTPKPPATPSQVLHLIRAADRAADPQVKIKSLKKLKSIAAHSAADRRVLESAGAVEFLSRAIISHSHDQVSDEALRILSQLNISEDTLRRLATEVNGDKGTLFDSLARLMSRASYESRASALELMKSVLQVLEPVQAGNIKVDHLIIEVVHVLKDRVAARETRAALKVLALACPWGRNRLRAIEAGAVHVIVDFLMKAAMEERRSVEMGLAVLDQLCGCAEGRAELLAHGGGLAVVAKKILRVSHFASERAVRILVGVAKYSAGAAVVEEMAELGVVTKLCLVLQVGCDGKTKERVREILRLHARVWRASPCAPLHVLSTF